VKILRTAIAKSQKSCNYRQFLLKISTEGSILVIFIYLLLICYIIFL